MTAKWEPPNTDDLIQRYLAGSSEKELAELCGVSRTTFRKRVLLANGIQPRGKSEALSVRMSKLSPQERKTYSERAYAPIRENGISPSSKIRAAQTNERTTVHASPLERYLAVMLAERGVPTNPQTAVGPYNCDLTADGVAVEVYGGKWHFYGGHLARADKRLRYLLDSGWHVIVVLVNESHPLTPQGADHLAAFIKAADRDPAAIREYRMIGGSGEDLARESADLDHLTVIYPRSRTRDPATGRYKGVPR